MGRRRGRLGTLLAGVVALAVIAVLGTIGYRVFGNQYRVKHPAPDSSLAIPTDGIYSNGAALAPLAPQSHPTMTPTQLPGESAPRCLGTQLAASVDTGDSGPGVAVVSLANAGGEPCWLAGVPTVGGVADDGGISFLAFTAADEESDSAPSTGPGVLTPGATGAVRLSLQAGQCSVPGVSFAQLELVLPYGGTVRAPWPAQLSASGCYGVVGEAGPVAR